MNEFGSIKNFSDYIDFEDFCLKNDFTQVQGLEFLDKECRMNDKEIDFFFDKMHDIVLTNLNIIFDDYPIVFSQY